jgi:hypothetical protein
MRTVMVALAIIVGGLSGSAWAASVQNTDNQGYELIIVEPGYRQDVVRRPFQILEHSRTEICHYGCDLYLRSTGQGVSIGPDDTVTISWGVMRVERSYRNTP